MTAPLFLVPPAALDSAGPGTPFTLDGEEGRHAATVRRLRPGEHVDLADGAGRLARTRVETARRDRLDLRVLGVDRLPAPQPRLVLVQALAKGGRDELAVQTATELGADEIIPWQARNSVVVWQGERGERSRRRWETTVRAAAKQSRRADLPPVSPAVTTAGLAGRVRAAAATVLLHEAADRPLATLPLPVPGATGEVLIIVGPEGGIADAELVDLGEAGAVPVRLGRHVLRTSSAGAAALAVLSVRLGRWGGDVSGDRS
ncbi:MAG: 16S rRNA (uracil(1498)-N(3))-methyltransferase [Kineosporiaceae bacterium]